MAKYEIADQRKVLTSLTMSQYQSILHRFKQGKDVSPYERKEFAKVAEALLLDVTVVFSAEEELPF